MSALQPKQRALDIRMKLFEEEHPEEAKSYFDLGVAQHASEDFFSALQSKQRALDIRVKLFGEEHSDTAQSYFSLGVTQHASGDFLSALESKQRALDIRDYSGKTSRHTSALRLSRRNTNCLRQFLVSTSVRSARS